MDISINNYSKLDESTTISQHSQGVDWDKSSNMVCTDLIWVPTNKHTRISPDIDPKYNFMTDKYNTFSKSSLSNIAYIYNDEEESDELSSQSTDSSIVNDKSTYYCHSISSSDSLYINNDNSYPFIQMKDRSLDKNREEKLSHPTNNTKHNNTTTTNNNNDSVNFNLTNSDTNSITDFHENTTEDNGINSNIIIHHIKIPSDHPLSQKQQHRKSFSEYMMTGFKKEKKPIFGKVFQHRNTKNVNTNNNNNNIDNNKRRFSLYSDSIHNNHKLFSFISIKSIIPLTLSKKSSTKRKKNSKDSSSSSLSPPSSPPIYEIDYLENRRLPIQLERGIYRLSHTKLMDYQRPLHQQVIISNLMYWYLSLTNPNIKRQKPKSLSSPDSYMEDNIRYIHITKRKTNLPQRISSPPLKHKWNHKLNSSPLR
ncbi:unnamed protein product [Cunninghamella blakesleeana]